MTASKLLGRAPRLEGVSSGGGGSFRGAIYNLSTPQVLTPGSGIWADVEFDVVVIDTEGFTGVDPSYFFIPDTLPGIFRATLYISLTQPNDGAVLGARIQVDGRPYLIVGENNLPNPVPLFNPGHDVNLTVPFVVEFDDLPVDVDAQVIYDNPGVSASAVSVKSWFALEYLGPIPA